MIFHVRVWFRWFGETVFDDLGPFTDRWMAECVTESFAHRPYLFGITPVHVERALILPGGWA